MVNEYRKYRVCESLPVHMSSITVTSKGINLSISAARGKGSIALVVGGSRLEPLERYQ